MVKLVWEVIEQISEELDPMGHGCNYSGHILGTAAGLSNLDILERESLTENTRDTGAHRHFVKAQPFARLVKQHGRALGRCDRAQ